MITKDMIRARYYGPTDTLGSRIVVSRRDLGRMTVPYDYAARDAHAAAVLRFADRHGLSGRMTFEGHGIGGTRYYLITEDAAA